MKGSRGRQAETSSDKRDKQDDLTRTRSRNPVLARYLSINKVLLLD
jgi:hypothetical protein